MDDWERHVTPLLQDMGCPNEEAQDDFFNQQDVSDSHSKRWYWTQLRVDKISYRDIVFENNNHCWTQIIRYI